jgi:peptidoglycan/LPS O-acetylase OafA/YrhL
VNPKKHFREDIQALRGLAVMSVLFFHAQESIFKMGYLGVDVFFCISGFVVTPLLIRILIPKNRHASVKEELVKFYLTRFYRLVPALVVTIIIMTLAVSMFANFTDAKRAAYQTLGTMLLVGNWSAYMFAGDYFAPSPNPFIHTWSLSIEGQIYLLLPLLLLLILRNRIVTFQLLEKIFIGITLVSASAFVTSSLMVNQVLEGENHFTKSIIFYSTPLRLWEFTLGGLCYFVNARLKNKIYRNWTNIPTILTCGLILLLFSTIKFNSILALLLVNILTGLILTVKNSSHNLVFVRMTLSWLGNRSYSIYLLHMPFLYLARYSPIDWGIIPREIPILIALVITFPIGAMIYTSIENRYRWENIETNLLKRIQVHLLVLLAVLIPLISVPLLNIKQSGEISFTASPSMGAAAYDWDSTCRVMQDSRNMVPQPCSYGPRNSKKSILVIGDSQAASYSKKIVDVANELRMESFVWTMAGCLYLPDYKPKVIGKIFNEVWINEACKNHNRKIDRWIIENEPDVIVYAHRSSNFYLKRDSKNLLSTYRNIELESLERLAKMSEKLILIGALPEGIPNSIFQQLVMPSPLSLINLQENTYWRDRQDSQIYRYIDLVELFCTKEKCPVKIGTNFLYSDSVHASKFGASLINKSLRIYLNEK